MPRKWTSFLPGGWRTARAPNSTTPGRQGGFPLAPVNSIADLLVSPQLRARSFFYEPFDQDLRSGAIGPPFKFSETPWTAGGCSRQGEDTREVYGRLLGLDEAALDELAQCGVI